MTSVDDDGSRTPADEVETLRARVAELESTLQRLRDEHRVALEHERLRHREHALGLVVEGEAARDRNRLLAKRVTRLRTKVEETTRAARRRERDLLAEIEAIHASRTWRAGRALSRPVRGRRP
jgi:hypothetical protein